jgi:hypothetical protein
MSSLLKFPSSGASAYLTHPTSEALRRMGAVALGRASLALDRWSQQLARSQSPRAQPMARLEFHADAGAPEGALYVDGRLVGWIAGVSRL